MSLLPRIAAIVSLFLVAGVSTVWAQPGDAPTHGAMQPHFEQVTAVHQAVIRGDLDAARKAAAAMANRAVAGPPDTAAFRDELRSLAGRVASAQDLQGAAMATGSMLRACGDCHRAAGVMPALVVPARPAVGKTVGHMLDHQKAVDQLLQGLVIPSSTLWNQGAQALRTAPLDAHQLPRDPKLTEDVAVGERRIHELADQAAGTSEPQARAAVYGQLLTACAQCHSLHKGIWGPSKQ